MRMMQSFGLACTLVFTSCGEKREYTNPQDPKFIEESGGETTTGGSVSPIPTPGSSSCPGGDCTTANGDQFNFANSFDATPTGCTATHAHAFEQGSGLAVFTVADCGSGPVGYLVLTSYSGVATTSYTPISDCAVGEEVDDFAVDIGNSGFATAYVCKDESSSRLLVRGISISGELSPSEEITGFGNLGGLRMRWHPTAQGFLVTYGKYASRVSGGGSLVGGKIEIAGSYRLAYPQNILVNSTGWIMSDGYNTTCISTSGNVNGRTNVAKTFYGIQSGFLLSRHNILYSMNFDSCELSAVSGDESGYYDRDFISLNSQIGAVVYLLRDTLLVDIVKVENRKLVTRSTSSIADVPSFNEAFVSIANEKIYVSFSAESKAKVVYSVENVQR